MRRILFISIIVAATCALVFTAAALAQSVSLPEHMGWMQPKQLSNSEQKASRGPQLAVDVDGDLHLLWTDDTTGQADPYYAWSDDGGSSWSAGELIDTDRESFQGSLALGSDDRIHICWWEESQPGEYELLHAKRTAGVWVQETVVLTGSLIQGPSILEAADYVHIVWSDYLSSHFDLYYSRKVESGSTWADPVFVTNTEPSSLHPRMTADGDGNLHVVWQENTLPNEIMYISGTVEADHTTWSDPITVSEKIAPNATSPHIAVGEDGMAHVVFGVDVPGQQNVQDVYHASFPIGNADDISPALIPGSRVEISQQLPNYASPSIALDEPDDVHVAWNGLQDGDIWDRIYWAVSHDGGASWSEPLAISADDTWADGFPAIATDGTLVHVAWQQQELISDNDIYYAHSLPLVYHFALAFKGY
ncbi:MAG TPA: sialidase family protein [Anaerolineae bacterium]|nr:sialidase family protein [Anaerolineae bacterium]